MTIQTQFFDWSRSGINFNAPPFEEMSPNLLALRDHLLAEHGGQYLGGEGDRNVIGGTTISAHAFGAALDWRYTGPGPGRPFVLQQVIPWLIDNSAELGIDAIHDYVGSRIWRAGRTSRAADAHTSWWRTQPQGSQMGQPWALWLHIETHHSTFHDDRPITARFAPQPDPPLIDPEEDDMAGIRIIICAKHRNQTVGDWYVTDGLAKTWVPTGRELDQIAYRVMEALGKAPDYSRPPDPIPERVALSDNAGPALDGLRYVVVTNGNPDFLASYGPIVGPRPAGTDEYGR